MIIDCIKKMLGIVSPSKRYCENTNDLPEIMRTIEDSEHNKKLLKQLEEGDENE